jgi:hypothetical protein
VREVDIDLAGLTGGAVSLAEAGRACVETTATTSAAEVEVTSASGGFGRPPACPAPAAAT